MTHNELDSAFRSWKDVEAPEGLAERALAQCVVEPVRGSSRRPSVSRAAWWMMAPAAVGLAVAVFAWHPFGPRPVVATQQQLTADQRYALAALGRAAGRVSEAQEESTSALVRALRAARLGERSKL